MVSSGGRDEVLESFGSLHLVDVVVLRVISDGAPKRPISRLENEPTHRRSPLD